MPPPKRPRQSFRGVQGSRRHDFVPLLLGAPGRPRLVRSLLEVKPGADHRCPGIPLQEIGDLGHSRLSFLGPRPDHEIRVDLPHALNEVSLIVARAAGEDTLSLSRSSQGIAPPKAANAGLSKTVHCLLLPN